MYVCLGRELSKNLMPVSCKDYCGVYFVFLCITVCVDKCFFVKEFKSVAVVAVMLVKSLCLTLLHAGNVIYLRGVDVVTGTPVIDIKPYIPQYDSPWSDSPWNVEECMGDSEIVRMKHGKPLHLNSSSSSVDVNTLSVEVINCPNCDTSVAEGTSSSLIVSDQNVSENTARPEVSVAKWITDSTQHSLLVMFTRRAEQQLKLFDSVSLDANYKLRHLGNARELRSAVTAVLQADPRSVYRRQHCCDQLYYVSVDIAHVTCWFDTDTVEVLKIQSLHLLQKENHNGKTHKLYAPFVL